MPLELDLNNCLQKKNNQRTKRCIVIKGRCSYNSIATCYYSFYYIKALVLLGTYTDGLQKVSPHSLFCRSSHYQKLSSQSYTSTLKPETNSYLSTASWSLKKCSFSIDADMHLPLLLTFTHWMQICVVNYTKLPLLRLPFIKMLYHKLNYAWAYIFMD